MHQMHVQKVLQRIRDAGLQVDLKARLTSSKKSEEVYGVGTEISAEHLDDGEVHMHGTKLGLEVLGRRLSAEAKNETPRSQQLNTVYLLTKAFHFCVDSHTERKMDMKAIGCQILNKYYCSFQLTLELPIRTPPI